MKKLNIVVLVVSLLLIIVGCCKYSKTNWGDGGEISTTIGTVTSSYVDIETKETYSNVVYEVNGETYDKWFRADIVEANPTIYYVENNPLEYSRLTNPINTFNNACCRVLVSCAALLLLLTAMLNTVRYFKQKKTSK